MTTPKKNLLPKLGVTLLIVAAALIILPLLTAPALMQKSAPSGQGATPDTAIQVQKALLVAQKSDGKGEPEASSNSVAVPNLVTGTTYPFTNAGGVPLEDMSSGTTQLVAANQDDTASAVTNLGFEFWFDGVRQTQFSVNANGLFGLGAVAVNNGASGRTNDFATATNNPKMSAYWDDMCTGVAGKVHFKVVGSAPTRKLVVEWLNMVQFDNVTVACSTTVRGTYQLWLFETTGVIQMVNGGSTTNDNGNAGYGVGVGSSSTSFASITTAGPTVSYAASSNANVAAIAAGTQYTLTPNVPAAPTALNFTSVTALGMTLNWTDNATNEFGYAIYQSLDGTNFTFFTQTAANATSQAVGGLNPSTTYFWRVFAVSEGALSTVLAGSQTTSAAGVINSTAAGGLWSAPATWVGGVVPSGGDNVTIVNGATVTIDTAAVALSLTVGTGGAAANLQYEVTTARTLTVGQSVTIASNGTFQSAATGTVTTHVLSVGTDLTNNGVLDFSTNANTAGAGITFTGAANNTFGGAGATTDIRTLTVNKGTSSANAIDLATTNFTVQGVTTDVAGFLTLTNGTLKISGIFTGTNRVFPATAYTIPATAGIWLNNPNYTIAGQAASPTNNGLLRVSQGTFNIGSASGNAMGAGTGAAFNIEGGTVNFGGRLLTANAVTYTQSGGTVNVCTVGNASSLTQSFGLTSATTVFNMSGGTINLVQINSTATAANRRDYSVLGTANITGGTLNVGTAATTGNAGNFDFRIGGQVPALVLNNTTNSKNVILISQMNTFGNVTVNTGCSINTGANVWLIIGAMMTNNGTITVPTNLSRFYFLGGVGPQSYAGSGTTTIVTTAGSVDMTVDNVAGLTIDPASNGIVTQRVNFFHGGITNANKITLGNGGTTVGVVQYGLANSPDTAGNFDVAPIFNIGTGGQTILYAQEGTARTTSVEIPASRTITNMSISNTNGLIIAGGDLTLAPTTGTSTLTFTTGTITTNANTLILSTTSTVARTLGHVIGNFRKNYAAAGSKLFEVGTANGFSPVTVNITAGTFPAPFTVKAVQGPHPNIGSPTHALQRYWVLTGTGVTADLTFNYLDPTDVPVTAVEANFVILKFDGTFTQPGGTVNTGANTASITGVSSFSDWTLAEPGAPTVADLNWFTADTLPANAKGTSNGVLLRWQTGYEVANLGFYVYREEGGKRVRVSPDMIAGSAFFVGARTALGAGRAYAWRDPQGASSQATYFLESIDLNGFSTWYGPVHAGASGIKAASVGNDADSKSLRDLGADQNAGDATSAVERQAGQPRVTAAGLVMQAAVASQGAVKIAVSREGWYRISQADLAAAGLGAGINPALLQLSVDGQQQPLNLATNKDGSFAGIEFYGTGIDSPYTSQRTYWLNVGAQAGLRIPQIKSAGLSSPTGSFAYTIERRDRSVYFPSLLNGDRENFFGAVIARDAVDQTLNVTRLDTASSSGATLEVNLQGVTALPHSVKVELNGNTVGIVSFAGLAAGSGRFTILPSQLLEGSNTLRLTSQAGPSDVSVVDNLRLTYPHRFTADNDALRVTVTGKQQIAIDGFSSAGIRVLDITNPGAVQELLGSIQAQKGGYGVSLNLSGTGTRTLLAVGGELAQTAGVAADQPSSWRQPNNGADLIMVTRRELAAGLEPLRMQRQRQGYAVAVAYVDDIYDEFSYGQKTPQAVKDFLAYARTSWKKSPRFVLLAGDASFDPKNYLGFGDGDLVPSKLVDTALMESISDDALADFNDDGVPEMAVGRLPVRTIDEALLMATKIVSYDGQTPAENMLLVSDLNDSFDFANTSNQLIGFVPSSIRIETLDRNHLDNATMHARLIEAINRGQRVVNYVGHGSVNQWRANILTSADAAALTNSNHLSLFVMMTCLNGYYQDAALESLGESLMKAERGGAVAVWASSGMTMPDIQAVLNQQAYGLLFGASPLTLGEVTARAKASVSNPDVRRTWILLGDPTTRIQGK